MSETEVDKRKQKFITSQKPMLLIDKLTKIVPLKSAIQ